MGVDGFDHTKLLKDAGTEASSVIAKQVIQARQHKVTDQATIA